MRITQSRKVPGVQVEPTPAGVGRIGLPAKNPREIARFGDRLASELDALIRLVPPAHLTASALSRWLGINRGTCQRVLLAARAAGDGVEALRRAPGVDGMDEFVKAIGARIGRRAEVDLAEAMVQDYAHLVQRAGGSHSKLVRLGMRGDTDAESADAQTASPREDALVAARREIYQASWITTGARTEANVGFQAFRPSEDAPGMVDAIHARGFIGLRRRTDGLALSSRMSALGDIANLTTLEGEKNPGKQWSALLAEFCTLPLPTVITQRENNTVNSIVLGDNAVERPVDVVLGGRGVGGQPDPRSGKISHLTAMFGLRFPARAQVYDFYLHRDLAAGARVFANALASHPRDADPVHSWFDKLAYAPRITAMGPGPIARPSPAYARMSELASWVFVRTDWDPNEFEAWRIEIEYPTPGVTYAITVHPASAGAPPGSETP